MMVNKRKIMGSVGTNEKNELDLISAGLKGPN